MRNSLQFWSGRLPDVGNVKESSLTWFHSSVQSVNIRCIANEADISLHYKLMKLIEKRSEISQRELAAELGLSLGKVNYCLKAFIARGLVKVNNFRRSDNKRAYAYLLTPQGIDGCISNRRSFDAVSVATMIKVGATCGDLCNNLY